MAELGKHSVIVLAGRGCREWSSWMETPEMCLAMIQIENKD